MHLHIAKTALAVLHASLLVALAACQSLAPGNYSRQPLLTSSTALPQQLIVKFKAATFRCDSADIARLATQIDTRLEFIRPMSGGACVLRQFQPSTGDFSRGQKLLRQHPSIEWVEPDSVMKTM